MSERDRIYKGGWRTAGRGSFFRSVAHGIRNGYFEPNWRRLRWVLLGVGVAVVVAVSYLLLTSYTAAQGRRIEQLRAELLRLEAENELLEVQIARASTVEQLATRAAQLGFVPVSPTEVEYLVIEGLETPAP